MKYIRPKKKIRIGLISAVSSEGLFFIRKLKPLRTYPVSGPFYYSGSAWGAEIIYSISGIGKTNAAHAATVLIREHSPKLVINFGAGGTYPSSGLTMGDIMVAESEVYGDEGVLDTAGFHGMDYMNIPVLKKGRKKYYNELALDRRLAKKAVESARTAFRGLPDAPNVESGRFMTVSTCTGTRKRADELRKTWGAICENMEGAAVAHICTLYDIPLIEIRGTSNIVEDRDRAKWDLKLASENCCKAVLQLLKALEA